MDKADNRREIRIGTEDYKKVIALERYAELSTLYCTMMNFNRYHCDERDGGFSKELISAVETTLATTSSEMQKLQNDILQFPEGDFAIIVD